MVDNEVSSIDSMPTLLNSKDLVALGLYGSVNAAYLARVHGDSPDFIKLKHKVLYRRESVLDFLQRHTHSSSQSVTAQEDNKSSKVSE